MSNFKVGDRVRCISSPVSDYSHIGLYLTVSAITDYGNIRTIKEWSDKGWAYSSDWFELVEETSNNYIGTLGDTGVYVTDNYKRGDIIQVPAKKTIMSNLITTFKNITRTEPNKTFVKAGVMNEDITLTSEGKELFIQFMFDKHAAEFKTDVVDKIIAEQEKK